MKDPERAKTCLLLCAISVVSGFLSTARATPINITLDPSTLRPVTDLSKGLLGNNSPQANFSFLLTEVDLFNKFSPSEIDLPTPTFAGFGDFSSSTMSVTGFDYAVLHYGTGEGGMGSGGGIAFYYLAGAEGIFSFPTTGLGTNGRGGLSSVRLFRGIPSDVGVAPVPETATTGLLLAVSFGAIAALFLFAESANFRCAEAELRLQARQACDEEALRGWL